MTDTLKHVKSKMAEATRRVTDQIAELRAQIDQKRQELDDLRRLPLPLAEIEQHIRAHVAEIGHHWLQTKGIHLIYGPRSFGNPDRVGSAVDLPWLQNDPMPWPALCAADPARAEGLLLAMVQRVPFTAGLPRAERPAAIAALTRTITQLEAVEEALIDDAADAGVSIKHRPETVERRERQARMREFEAQRLEAQAARQTAIDAEHRERARDGRSPYLLQQAAELEEIRKIVGG